MLKLAFTIMGPTVPRWDEKSHLRRIEKRLEDRVFVCHDLEGTSDIIHQSLIVAEQFEEKSKNREGIFRPAGVNENGNQ